MRVCLWKIGVAPSVATTHAVYVRGYSCDDDFCPYQVWHEWDPSCDEPCDCADEDDIVCEPVDEEDE